LWKEVFYDGWKLDAVERKEVGLGSPDIRPGDLVCIFFGCSVPVVLRKIRD
jgi:hypothetical protein